eukprot:comp24636_c0_seq1/m.46812 comp24636_c0_seq1/g.46812  ORF comp24636_c0_seq1/g.46812 comp24636_c0_seq1/m.46812 type:complete len:239 (-) comp24636_c0_seq1:949-1665(-)
MSSSIALIPPHKSPRGSTLSPDIEALLTTESQALDMVVSELRAQRVNIANPGPTGLLAFGLTTSLAMLMATGATQPSSTYLLVAHATMHGGLLQLLAGMWEFRKGNIFGATVFSAYGVFWMTDTLYAILRASFNWPKAEDAVAMWFALWGIFSLGMGLCTRYTNHVLHYIFASLVITFFLLAAGEYYTTVHKVAGGVGVSCGAAALYLGWAELMNEVYGGEVVPIWPCRRVVETKSVA